MIPPKSSTLTTGRSLFPVIALSVVWGARFASVASAQSLALTTGLSGTAPSANVEISNTSPAGNNGAGQVAGNDGFGFSSSTRSDKGETFTVGATGFSLGAFTFQIAAVQSGAVGASFTLTLNSYANNSTATPSATVATYVGDLPSNLVADPSGANYYRTNPTYLTFSLPVTTLNANTTYGFDLGFTTQAANRNMNFFISYGNSYNGGIEFSYDGTTYTGGTNDITSFYIQSVPEPSQYLMMSFGMIAFVIAYRHRRATA